MTMKATTEAPRVLRLREVMARTGLRRDSVYRLGRHGDFPRPVKLTKAASGWLESEVSAWITARAAERDASGSQSAAA
jgi:prophage regulatory protein